MLKRSLDMNNITFRHNAALFNVHYIVCAFPLFSSFEGSFSVTRYELDERVQLEVTFEIEMGSLWPGCVAIPSTDSSLHRLPSAPSTALRPVLLGSLFESAADEFSSQRNHRALRLSP